MKKKKDKISPKHLIISTLISMVFITGFVLAQDYCIWEQLFIDLIVVIAITINGIIFATYIMSLKFSKRMH